MAPPPSGQAVAVVVVFLHLLWVVHPSGVLVPTHPMVRGVMLLHRQVRAVVVVPVMLALLLRVVMVRLVMWLSVIPTSIL